MGDVPAETGQVEPTEDDKEYNPIDYRPQENLNSDVAIFLHLLKSAIGSGILFLPNAFKNTGWVAALIGSAFIGLISTHTAVLVVHCSQLLCRRGRIPMLNYAQTAEASFQFGPERIRKYAMSVNILTNVMICFVQYQTAVIYCLYVASSFQQIIEHFAGNEWDERVYIIMFFPFYCAVSLVPNLKYLVPFSVIGALFLAIGFAVTLYYLFKDIESPGRLKLFTGILQFPVFCTFFLFAVHNMSMILPLENTMKTPGHMSVILTMSMILNVFIYVAFGFLGYNKYIEACDTVIKNLPLGELAAQIVKITITLSVMFTYGLQYYVPVSILWPMIAEKTNEERHCIYETLFRLGGVTVTTLLAVAVPRLGPLLGLFAAVGFTTVMLLIPVVIELATKWEDPGLGPCKCILIKNIIIIMIWALLLIVGTFESMKTIIKEYGGKKDEEDDNLC